MYPFVCLASSLRWDIADDFYLQVIESYYLGLFMNRIAPILD